MGKHSRYRSDTAIARVALAFFLATVIVILAVIGFLNYMNGNTQARYTTNTSKNSTSSTSTFSGQIYNTSQNNSSNQINCAGPSYVIVAEQSNGNIFTTTTQYQRQVTFNLTYSSASETVGYAFTTTVSNPPDYFTLATCTYTK